MDNLVFTSVAFGQAYLDQQRRLKQSILDLYPEAIINFYYDCMPPGARPMNTSLYGFKPHAVLESLKLGQRVLWLDPAMIMVDKQMRDLTSLPLAVVQDDHKLSPFCSDQALAYFGQTRESIKDVHLLGGSLIYFDFRFQQTRDVFDLWLQAEKDNMYGGAGQRHTGSEREHRSDETILALAMHHYSMKPVSGARIRYCIAENPMFIKKHFK